EVVAQRERPVLGEQLVLGGQLAAHAARRLVNGGAPGEADRQRQQRRQNQGELGPEGQGRNASTTASKRGGRAVMPGRLGTYRHAGASTRQRRKCRPILSPL